ncbi:hypothetical protein, partial [Rhodonellum sp.]|uniref:hypothetical protein n=1 Tax=Rhodonellum sp. TaxID=2231180 RepID=UPI0027268C83
PSGFPVKSAKFRDIGNETRYWLKEGRNEILAPYFLWRNRRPIYQRFLAGIGEREENELAREFFRTRSSHF